MKQILTLRKELAKACLGDTAVNEVPWKIFVLLETVKNDIDPIILADVLKSIIPDNSVFLQEENLENDDGLPGSYEEDDDADGEDDTLSRLITPAQLRRQDSFEVLTSVKDILESQSYDEEYILAALQVCGRKGTKEDLLAWVIDCEEDDNAILALSQEAKRNPCLFDLVNKVFGIDSDTGNEDTSFEVSQPTR